MLDPDPSSAVPVGLQPRHRRLTVSFSGLPAWVGGMIGVAIILVVWWIASQTLYTDSHAIPTPSAVFAHFFNSSDWTALLHNFAPTIQAAFYGFIIGDIAALLMAVAVLLIPPIEELVNQLAIVTYCLPPVAIGPIVVIIGGQAHPQAAPIVLASLAPFFTTVVGCLIGLRAAPRASLDLVTAYGGSRMAQLRKVQVIAALPNVFAALKIAAPAAFLGAILAEFLGGGGDNSVGQALIAAQTRGDAARLWWLALCCGAVAGLGYLIVGLLARVVTPWTSGEPGGSR
ncbi:ABC-type nitrate/sulfonate/bicarbonate transport system, permease component [Frankineae bacterium MT45]|nr:ABC-type nitrate/sulfonate/bicarbonate transport system, permease component [Frankineae bacterium MT45]